MNQRQNWPDTGLSVVEACERLRRMLAWYGVPRMMPEVVLRADEHAIKTVVVLMLDGINAQTVRLEFDRHTGRVDRLVTPHEQTAFDTSLVGSTADMMRPVPHRALGQVVE